MQRLDVLFAAEHLLPAVGGAELYVLELLEALSGRGHRVRAVHLGGSGVLPRGTEVVGAPSPPLPGGYWRTKRLRREAVGAAVASELSRRPADVVVTQLHAGPRAAVAAAEAGAATLVSLPSYESLCKHAFDAGSACGPELDCSSCAAARELDAHERDELLGSRRAHGRMLASADVLVACSDAVAGATERWCGRRPDVVYPVLGRPDVEALGARDGPIVAAAARWSRNKGAELLEELVSRLPGRAFRVAGLRPDEPAARRLRAVPNVELAGPAPVAELVRGASIALVPSQWPEPFGRTAFEALAAGVPALASRVGGLVEHVPQGLLVQPSDDPAAWVAAVERLDDYSTWDAARAAGLSAAAATLRRGGLEPFEELLAAAAASRPRAPRRPGARSR